MTNNAVEALLEHIEELRREEQIESIKRFINLMNGSQKIERIDEIRLAIKRRKVYLSDMADSYREMP